MALRDPNDIDVLAPNFKRRMSGVTSTVVRLVPLQAADIAIAACGPRLPDPVPRVALSGLLSMSRRGPTGPRIWHARRNTEMLAGLALKRIFGKDLRLIFTSAAQRRHSAYTRWLLRQMDALIATSTRAAGYLDRASDVILHGIDTDAFAPVENRRDLRQRLGLDPDAVLVGCYGRVRPQKGTDLFVEAMCDMLPRCNTASAIVMGGVTPDQKSFVAGLKARVDAAGLGSRLRILPEAAGFSIAPWFQALDLYVAPHRWEGFGLTPLEAMAAGVPVVATRVGAFEDIVVDGETGTLIDAGDPKTLADAIAPYLDDPDRRAAHGAAGRARATAHFQLANEAAAINAIYRRLLSR
ncbi:MAG: glycosyltransferase family 4 protein [Pseudomonadota bacterium]